jgi:CRISPR/Cas system-associated exonuclease Cas4 (RecB family)
MNIPEGFQFSQANLQDYADCRRRFQLRYLQGVAWPALLSEPAGESERFLRLGQQFHRMAHQYLLGVPAPQLDEMVDGPEIKAWWENFNLHVPDFLAGIDPASRSMEATLTAPVDSFRIIAKLDFVGRRDDGKSIIVDWKTYRKKPRRSWLQERLQTRIYPYLLVRAGSQANQGKVIDPEQVEMVYWFASFPEKPERFSYNARQFAEDDAYLSKLVSEIQRLEESNFTMTPQLERCQFCVYRSLCDRGVQAGSFAELDNPTEQEDEFLLDFDQISEIEF